MTPTSEHTVYSDDFNKSIYNVRWYQLPSDEAMVNKDVTFRVDPSYNGDKENHDMVKRIDLAYRSTYGAGINPEAVPDLLHAIMGMLEPFSHIGGVGKDAKLKAMNAAKAAIEKATIKHT